jgi:hypothetical protein
VSYIQYSANNPYFATPQSSRAIGSFVFRAVPPNGADTLYTILSHQQYRPDRLSYDLYNTPAFWWIFPVRNPFLRADPVWGLTTGLQLMVPSADYLRRTLGA